MRSISILEFMLSSLTLTPVQRIMFCTARISSTGKSLHEHEFAGKFDAAIDMDQGVFGAGAFRVAAFFEVAGVVHEHGQQAQFEHPLRQARFGRLAMPPRSKARHARMPCKVCSRS
jgi:hypothetical protein